MIPIYNTIHRKTKETEINLEFEQVAPENGEGNDTGIRYVLNLQVKGDFTHHVIEDAMIALNQLAEIKGIGHKLV